MADVDQAHTRRRQDRSSSRSHSREYERRHGNKNSYARRRDGEGPPGSQNPDWSKDRNRPRKRRSLSPNIDSKPRKVREFGDLRGRDSDRYDERTSRRQKSPLDSSPTRRRRNSPQEYKRSKAPLASQQDAFNGEDPALIRSDAPEKQKPNFGSTGRLAAASNTVEASGGHAIVLKYHEPSEARKPSVRDRWRMYVFKDEEIVDTVELAEQSCWLFGREAAVADFLVEHPSCSKQHAVIQFRYMEKRNEFGDKTGKVRPYIIDLESANGTTVNEDRIPEGRYVELRDKDMIKFGHSTREYVVQLPPN